MPVPPVKRPDRHYNFERTNVVFAVSSIALLLATVWMVIPDYAKPWKRLQSQFRDLERQAAIEELAAEKQSLNENELAQLGAEVAAEGEKLVAQRAEIDELESDAVKVGKRIFAADAQARGSKSLLDTARYQLDQALVSGLEKRIEAAQTKVDGLVEKWTGEIKTLELLTGQKEQIEADLEGRRARWTEAEKRLGALRSGVDSLDERIANLDKRLDYFILNAPLTDFIEPDLKVEQVMISGLFQNINFTTVDRVDRCMTCHVASNRQGFDGERWEEPFRSHPRPELFVMASSPHPYATFGCSSCHGGLDRATDFARVGHSPQTQEQEEEWVHEWNWSEQKYLAEPIYPARYSEAGCVTCHAADVWTPGSQVQDTGRELITRLGCAGCHVIDYPAFRDLPRTGPSLNRVASKTNAGWAYKWIESPRDFHPTTWMPHFFFEGNAQLPATQARQQVEISSLVAYVWDKSEKLSYVAPPSGSATRGEELFNTVGCTGCHILDGEARRDDFFPQINRLNGPNLVGTGSKVDAGWLYGWLKDPKAYNPDTRMPNLRLSDQEAADLVAFLMNQRNPHFEGLEAPAIDGVVRDELALGYLRNNNTYEQSEAILARMTDHERNVFLGEETVQKYGCYGCHDLAGFERSKPIGVELTEEGSKPVHQFDFGHVHDVPHTRHDWLEAKLLDPRIWDEGKEAVKTYGELSKMPNFGLSEREAEAILTNVLGFTKESALASRKAGQSARAAALAEGRKLITYYNCQGCHLIEGKGHAILSSLGDEGQLPPNLAAEGARTQADWLFDFLHDPGSVRTRPWLSSRMPTFGLSDEEINALVAYFAATDESDVFSTSPSRPDDRRSLVVGEVTFGMLQCAKCHPAGEAEAGVSAGDLAPSLLLAPERLRHDWVPGWIKDPQTWIPGTNMPQNFAQLADGSFSSPLADAIDAPMFSAQKRRMMSVFESEEELENYLADADKVTTALRDHIWWGLN
ncbi:MAG: c-type cytochrome [Acidobacteria bacterium]|nr:c-type cytochrome [Acidobacteriota bacterium]